MPVDVLDGNKIRQELQRLGLTQRDLARFVHLPDEDVSRAVNGLSMSPEYLYIIGRGLLQLKQGKR